MRDPYDILEVPRSATTADINQSFRRLAKALHPDVHANDPEFVERFAELNHAHKILGDRRKRKAFDRGEIDAHGMLVHLSTWRVGLHHFTATTLPLVTCLMIGSLLGATATLFIQSRTPRTETPAPSEATTVVVPGVGAPEPQERAAPAEPVDQRVQPEPPRAQPEPPRLLVQPIVASANADDVPLGVQVTGDVAGAAVEISRLPAKMTLSTGRSLGSGRWRLRASEAANAVIHLPEGVRGTVDLIVELRLADDTLVDRLSIYRLDWAQIELLIKRGRELITEGDVTAARASLQRAAEARDARAALALGATYDPMMLARLRGIHAIAADVNVARGWYEKASELGSQDAKTLLADLAR